MVDKELKQSNLNVGKTDVIGEGVIVTLNDGQYEDIIAWDLIYLVNELKYAGAEAAEALADLTRRMASIGYEVVKEVGHHASLTQ